MTTNPHPLTETAAAELWNAHCGCKFTENTLTALRAAYDAGREHERERTPPVEITDKMVEAAADILAFKRTGTSLRLLESDCRDSWRDQARAALEVALAVATPAMSSEPSARDFFGVPDTHGAPHHDAARIRQGDFVVQVDRAGHIRAGIAYHQDDYGNWRTEESWTATWANRRADRPDAITVWPAPTPPAEEVELPTEFGAVITDVEADFGEAFQLVRMVWAGNRWTFWDYSTTAEFLTAFTLPDGTRVRRDGTHKDGRPRFVKEDT